MKRTIARSRILLSLVLAGAILPMLGSVASASVQKKHAGLSMSNVQIAGPFIADSGLPWIASKAGFFKKEGLNVTLFDGSSTTNSALIAGMQGGTFQFVFGGAAPDIAAAAAGAPLQAVMNLDIGSQQELAVSASFAAAHGIPSTTATKTQVLAQVSALKGSHMTVAISSVTSPSYYYLAAVCSEHGLTCSVNSPSADLDIVLAGNSLSEEAGYDAGKYNALLNQPPISNEQPNSIEIDLGEIPPVSTASNAYVATTTSFEKAHPDTVQAVVNALVEAWAYAHKYPSKALQLTSSLYAQIGYTSPEIQQVLFNAYASHWRTPLMLRSAYQTQVDVDNVATTPQISVGYDTFVNPKFVTHAVAQSSLTLGVAIPRSA